MTLFVILAILTAIVTAWCAHPLMTAGRSPTRTAGWFTVGGIMLISLMLYLALGQPGAASYPALFDTDSPRTKIRALTGEELLYMQALAEEPEDTAMIIRLANVRIRAGRPQDAISLLEDSLTRYPENKEIRAELTAAHYAAALTLLSEAESTSDDILYHIEKALAYAPDDAPYRVELEDIEKRIRTPYRAPSGNE